jgi:hypothetical protein
MVAQPPVDGAARTRRDVEQRTLPLSLVSSSVSAEAAERDPHLTLQHVFVQVTIYLLYLVFPLASSSALWSVQLPHLLHFAGALIYISKDMGYGLPLGEGLCDVWNWAHDRGALPRDHVEHRGRAPPRGGGRPSPVDGAVNPRRFAPAVIRPEWHSSRLLLP